MPKKLLLLFFLFLCHLQINAQTIIKGKVIDAETKTELPYTNIGILGTAIGTVSDGDGDFTLEINDTKYLKDRLMFSFLGYEDQFIPIVKLIDQNNTIELQPLADQLSEVTLTGKAPKEKTIGRNHTGTGTMWTNFYTAGETQNDRLGKEMGMKFNLRGNYRLKSLNFYIGDNEYNSVKFRLNVYQVEDNKPSVSLNKQDIIFDVGDVRSDWVSVDLDPYDIYLKEELESFAVTIQWLESDKKTPNSKFFSIPTGMSPLDRKFFREKGMADWKSSNQNLSFYLVVDKY